MVRIDNGTLNVTYDLGGASGNIISGKYSNVHKDSPRNSYGKTLSTREPIAYGKRKPSFVKLSVQPYHIIVARTY